MISWKMKYFQLIWASHNFPVIPGLVFTLFQNQSSVYNQPNANKHYNEL